MKGFQMKLLKQLSIFIENKPGTIRAVCEVLRDNQINIRTLSLADTQQFGILRFLVNDPEKAREVLASAGFTAKETEVLALPVADHPGGLAEILDVIDRNNLNVEYMYAFTFGREDNAVMVFRFADPSAALQALTAAGIKPVDVNLEK